MSNSKEKVRERYRQMTDEQLLKIAQYEAADLNPTGLEILQEEIKRRKLNPDLEKGIEAQIEGLTEDEMEELANLIRHSSCPMCEKTDRPLQSEVVTEIVSVIVFTNRKQNLVIACPDCLRVISNAFFRKNLILGWWGFPMGIIRTGQAVIQRFRSKERKEELSQQGIVEFSLANQGYLKANEDRPAAILKLIKENNAM